MVSLEVIAILLSGISISASLFYYATILQNANKTRQIQLFMQFYSKLTDKQFYDEFMTLRTQEWIDFDDYLEKYGYGPTLFDIYLEGVGLLVKRNQIDISMVDDLMSSLIINYWRTHGEIMLEMRKRRNMPQVAEWTEFLYNEIMKVAESQHPELAT
jgi:hypothetical protein